MDADWGLTKTRTLPPFLRLIAAHNAAYNRRLLVGRLVRAVILGNRAMRAWLATRKDP